MMRKIGPFSIDIVVACYVYHNQLQTGKSAPLYELVEESGISELVLLDLLNTLADWGVIRIDYAEYKKSGRAGRVYSVTDISQPTVKATYEQFWERIREEQKRQKLRDFEDKTEQLSVKMEDLKARAKESIAEWVKTREELDREGEELEKEIERRLRACFE